MNICIIDSCKSYIDETSFTRGLGGSETWTIQFSEELVRQGHTVTIIGKTKHQLKPIQIKEKQLNWSNVSWVDNILSNNKFDFVVISRCLQYFNINFLELIKKTNCTDKVFLQMHDLSVIYNEKIVKNDEIKDIGLLDPIVKGIVCLCDWHKKNLLSQINYPEDKIFIAPNGIDFELFKDLPTTKTAPHRILWSSTIDRGFLFLANDIYDRVKRIIPDFGIDIASYLPFNLNVNNKDIRVLGSLGKKELYKEMHSHNIWFYPCTFAETFCLTVLENVMCGVIPLSPFTCGMSCLFPKDIVTPVLTPTDYKDPKVIDAISKQIVDVINEYDKPIYQDWLKQTQEYITQTYTWKHTVDCWMDIVERGE